MLRLLTSGLVLLSCVASAWTGCQAWDVRITGSPDPLPRWLPPDRANPVAIGAKPGVYELRLAIAVQCDDEAVIRSLCAAGVVDPNRDLSVPLRGFHVLRTDLQELCRAPLPGGTSPMFPFRNITGGTYEVSGPSGECYRFEQYVDVDCCRLEIWSVSGVGSGVSWYGQKSEYTVVGIAGLEHDPSAGTPLATAASLGRMRSVAALVESGARVDERAADSRTPLMFAAAAGNAAGVSQLLQHGADPLASDRNGWMAIHWAAAADQPQTLEALLASGVAVDACDKSGVTPLMAASSRDAVAASEYLLSHGADLRALDGSGRNAMMYASRGGAVRAIGFLSRAGIDPEAGDQDGVSALMHAGTPEAARALMKLGAKMNRADPAGRTALMHAVLAGNRSVVDYFVAHGADYGRRDGSGRRAIDLAASQQDRRAVQMLRWVNRLRLEGRIGIDFSKINHSGQGNALGAEAGLGLAIRLGPRISLLQEVAYAINGSTLPDDPDGSDLPDIGDEYTDESDYFEFGTLLYRPTLRYDLSPLLGPHLYLLAGADVGSVMSAELKANDAGSSTPDAGDVGDYVNGTAWGLHLGAGFAMQTLGGTFYGLEVVYSRRLTDCFKEWSGPLGSTSAVLMLGR
jgi:ankyrin repeat protein